MSKCPAATTLLLTLALWPVASGTAAAEPARKSEVVPAQRGAPASSSTPTVDHRSTARPVIQVEVPVRADVETHSTERTEVHSARSREVRYGPEPTETNVVETGPDRGLHLGVDMGGGAVGGSTSGSLDVHVGIRFDSFALQLEYWLQVRGYFEPGNGLSQGMAMVSGQLWVQDKTSIKFGIGSAYLSEDGQLDAKGTALMGGVNYDWLDTEAIVLNVHAKAGVGLYRERGAYPTASLGAGFTWY